MVGKMSSFQAEATISGLPKLFSCQFWMEFVFQLPFYKRRILTYSQVETHEQVLIHKEQPVPCVVVSNFSPEILSDQNIHQKISEWLLSDDVLSFDFVKTVVLYRSSGYSNNSNSLWKPQALENWPLLRDLGTQNVIIWVINLHEFESVESGPYFINGLQLHSVFRVYEDPQEAFFSSIQQNTSNLEAPFIEERPTLHIKVSSRIGADTFDLPLSNLRFGLKDVFDV